MRRSIDRAEFGLLFETYSHTAFRLEARDRYNEGYTPEPMRRYLAGEPMDYTFMDVWTDAVRAAVEQGKRMERVRIVSEPLTDYVRYSMHIARLNNEAGEDIRYLPRGRATELGLPDIDFWLFDSVKAAILRYDDDDRSLDQRDLIDDPEFVVRCNRWRDVAWHYAIKRDEFAAKHNVE